MDTSRYVIAIGSDEIVIKQEREEDDPGPTRDRKGVEEFILSMGGDTAIIEEVFRIIEESSEGTAYLPVSWKGNE